jgi:ActR/RegA family two-component response regulator
MPGKLTKIRALLLTDPAEADRRIKRALEDNQGSIERSAVDLQMHYTSLHRILKARPSLRKHAAKLRVDTQGA